MVTIEQPDTLTASSGASVTAGPLHRRLRATAGSAAHMITAYFAVALLPLWLTAAALTPLTIVAPLLLPATWLVRRYADACRAAAGRVLGRPIASPYRASEPQLPQRIVAILRDPASWRDAWWLFVHALVAASLSLLSVTLLLGGVFYLIFPFLVAITPAGTFANALGFITIDSTASSFAMMPLALVGFGLWWLLAEPLQRAVAATDRALLR